MALKRPGVYVGLSANYADDEKIMDAGEDAELLYIRMLAYAARTPLTEGWISDSVLKARLGILPRDSHDQAGNVTGTVPGTDALSRAEALREVGLIAREDTGWRIVSWLKWNRSIEEMGKERSRDAKRKAPLTSDDPETGRETAREKGREKATSPGNKDQDQDQDHIEGSRKRSARKPSVPIRDDWKPTAKHHEYADEHGVDVSSQMMKFRNHAVAKDLRYADWDAAFRNWLVKAVEYGQTSRPREPEQKPINYALMPKCPTCNAPQEITHYDQCTDQEWEPSA